MSSNNANQKLNDLLLSRDFNVQTLDAQGKPPQNPDDAVMYSFDYKGDTGKDYGTVIIMLTDDLTVYCGDNVGKTMEPEDKNSWFNFLQQLRQFAMRNAPGGFGIQNLNKLKYSMQGQAALKEGLFEGWSGTKNTSWNAAPTEARLMIKHKKTIGEGDARFRYIESLFIETADGERFRMPFKSLSAGRAMLEHVRQGGKPYDYRGNHITTIVEELNLLSRFKRANQGRIFEGETQQLVEEATQYYESLRRNLKSLGTKTGYQKYFESWNPATLTDEDVIIEDLRHLFVEQNIDSRVEQALPLLAKLKQEHTMKEANIFESMMTLIIEGTWALPDTKEKQQKLVALLADELPVGPDATNATEILYDLLGDDILFDKLADLAQQDANADARTVIIDRLEELKDNPDVAQVVGQLKIATVSKEPKLDESIKTEGYHNFAAHSYAEQLALKVFQQNPNLIAKGSCEEVIDAGWPIAVQDNGRKRAEYDFSYDEDFTSDFVSAYAWLQLGGNPETGEDGEEYIKKYGHLNKGYAKDGNNLDLQDSINWPKEVPSDTTYDDEDEEYFDPTNPSHFDYDDDEKLNELSPSTLKNYIKKSSSDRAMRNFDQGVDAGSSINDREPKFDKENDRKDTKRLKGIHKALNRLEESGMSRADEILSSIARGETDLYTVMTHPDGPEEQYVARELEKMYGDIINSDEIGSLHPDDDFEQILELMVKKLAQRYGVDEGVRGAIAGGALGGYATKSIKGALTGAKIGSALQDRLSANETVGGGSWLEESTALQGQYGHSGKLEEFKGNDPDTIARIQALSGIKEAVAMNSNLNNEADNTDQSDIATESTALQGQYGHSGKLQTVEGIDQDMMDRIKFLAGVRNKMRANEFLNESWYPEPRPYVPGEQLSKSEVRVGDMVYFWMDPRARGKEPTDTFKLGPRDPNSPAPTPRKYPEPRKPYIKDGKTVGSIGPDGKVRPLSKSDAIGPDGMIYNWMDPRARGEDPASLNAFRPQVKEESRLDQIRQGIATQQAEIEKQRAEKEKQRAEQQAQRAEQRAEQDKQEAEQDKQRKEEKARPEMIVRAAINGDTTEWDKLTRREQFSALEQAGLMSFSDRMSADVHPNKFNADEIIAQARIKRQDQQHQIDIGPEKRAELKAKADALAEIKRQQLQKEKLEAEKLAYQKYKDDADRTAAMKKIEMEYKHDLEMVNTEHRNNMEAIKTGNAHEINKINLDHAEAERERKHDMEKEKMRQQQQQQKPPREMPDLSGSSSGGSGITPDDADEEPGEPFRPQAPAGPALTAPAPSKPASKWDTDDVIDVDAKEVPEKPNKPAQLPKPTNECTDLINRICQLAGR